MKVVIVGCGWLGKLVAVQLMAAGLHVYGSCRHPARVALLPEGVNPLLLDLTAGMQFSHDDVSVFKDAVIICAIPPGKTIESQYLQSLSVLTELMQKAGSLGCIHFSSTGIYQGLSGNVTEDSEPDRMDERVRLLFDGEQLLRRFKPCITLRLAGLMGPGRHPGRFSAGKTLPNPDSAVNMIHSVDIGIAVQHLLTQPLQHAIYNLSCPDFVSRKHFYTEAYALLQMAAPEFSVQTTHSRRVIADKICQQTGFHYTYRTATAALAGF